MIRVLSAAILLPAVLAVVWFLPPVATLLLAIAASELAFVEFSRLARTLGVHVPPITSALVIATCASVGSSVFPLDVVLMAALLVAGCAAVAALAPGPAMLPAVAFSLFAVLYLGLPFGALAAIRWVGGREAIVLLMLTIVISDSGQYYTGRAFGRTPLAPAISPKKTREGAIGGVLLGAAAMAAGARVVFPGAPPAAVVIASIAVVVLGVFGDLFESLLKRSAGVKDSSHLIPGHGGILDRVDSWLFAGPAYYLFIRYLQA
jgi:phosphatidate cytidylyltransferase